MKKLFIISIAALLSSCSLVPDYQTPKISTPDNWMNKTEENKNNEQITKEWWTKFKAPELDQVIARALSSNQDLAASLARIEQAKATAKIAGADLLPTADLSATGNTGNDYNFNDRNNNDRSSSSANLTISYELDLFGKNRTASKAAKERLKASRFDNDALTLVVESDVAQAYTNALAFNDRVAIAQNNLDNANKVLAIVQARFDNGINSQLEVSQQRTAVANFEANLSSLKQQQQANLTELAILAGVVPQKFSIAGQSVKELQLPSIANIQPAELITRRPDIASAEANLKAANMDIGVARAALFPDLNISLDNSVNSLSSPENLTSSLIGSITQPIFHGGALKANVEYSEARKKELAADYYTTVLNALKEVDDAYSALQHSKERVEINQRAVDAATSSSDLALERFKNGATDFQTLLDVQTSQYQTQDALLQAESDQIVNSVVLFKALGGGWISQ